MKPPCLPDRWESANAQSRHAFELAVCAGQGQAEGSYEYLVFNSTLLGVAAEHGLHPITDWEDPELDECFDQAYALASHACLLSWQEDSGKWGDCEGERGRRLPVC